MKFSLSVVQTLLAVLAAANPVELEERKAYGTTANEYTADGCATAILFFARGTTQPGNLGDMPGQQLATQLSTAIGTANLHAQGINYPASLEGNYASGGCPEAQALAMTKLITQAATSCPNAKLIVAGYSQGSAMVHRSIEAASAAVVEHIAAAVTFGDTQCQQDGGKIPNIPVGKTKIFCNKGDLVCNGTLDITSAHLNYLPSVPSAVTFIKSLL
ncbi:cutinase [Xylariales sp. PMI_506]|nr:cutinase [Xylariales sp. PMI_506]